MLPIDEEKSTRTLENTGRKESPAASDGSHRDENVGDKSGDCRREEAVELSTTRPDFGCWRSIGAVLDALRCDMNWYGRV